MKFKKKSSSLKLLSQSQPNFAEMKQQWTIKISSPLFSIFSLTAILVGVGITGHTFERGPSKVHSTKVWLQLAQWFLRRIKCEMLTDDSSQL
jgi:hypothetical protein